jgi:hypothetical protein
MIGSFGINTCPMYNLHILLAKGKCVDDDSTASIALGCTTSYFTRV